MARLLAALALLAPLAAAEVVGVEIAARSDVLDGRPFGEVGAYEKLIGTIRYAFDPANGFNAAIVDLDRAPRNADGLVEAHGDLMVLRPKDPSKGSGTALLEVSNRGGKAALGYFNRALFASDPSSPAHFGDGLLMRRGLTVIWIGWQFDVPAEPGRLRLHVPVARGDDGPLLGLVRADWVVDAPVRTLPLAHRDHVAYPVARRRDERNVLTARDGRLAPREVVPADAWSFSVEMDGILVPDRTHVTLEDGFEPGRIYECVYVAQDPPVVGLGLAAVRDAIAYAKHDESCPFPVERGIAVGISQTGRFLRHFLYQGFNTDERGRPAFDGMLVHTAGAGRGSFNHRFAQPSRDGHRYSTFFFPTDLFPFAGRPLLDGETGVTDGLLTTLAERGHVPKTMFTNTGYEYWGRAAALLHVTPDGALDVGQLPDERLYHLASAQHFLSGFPPRDEDRLEGARAWKGNPLDFLLAERALLVALLDWVEDDVQPPPTAVPRMNRGTLVPPGFVAWPAMPGVATPEVAHEAYRVDYGPDWERGLIAKQPPELGPPFPTLVPQVDGVGNERGGLPTVETLVPVATYLPWHLRAGLPGGNGELTDFFGTVVPLPRTDAEAEASGDGRPSLERLYPSRAFYLERARAAAAGLVEQRLLLEEDVPEAVERAAALWDWVSAAP